LSEEVFGSCIVCRRIGQKERPDGIIEKCEKNYNKNKFKKDDKEMTHHPASTQVIDMADFGHEILKRHNCSFNK